MLTGLYVTWLQHFNLKAGLNPWAKEFFVRGIGILLPLIFTSWKTCLASFNYSSIINQKTGKHFVLVTSKELFFFPSWGGGLCIKAEKEEP